MLPGKKYSPAEILQIALARKWLIVTFLVVGAAVAVVVSRRLPDLYRSESLIVATPQRISDNFVKQSVAPGLEERLPTISEQIMSRARLERMIDDFHLYSDLRRKQSLDDVVKRMRTDVEFKVEGVDSNDRRSNHLLRISYVNPDARTAQQVVERLTSLVIDESLRDRQNLAQNTNDFLASQLEDAKARLIAHEKKLESYRQKYSGQLPTQAPANLQAIQNTQLQLQVLSEAADRARERRVLVERQLADLQSDPLTELALTPPGTPDGSGQPTEVQLEAAKARLRTLQLRGDKPNHPDVQIAQRAIRDLEAKLEAENNHPTDAQGGQKPATPAEALRQRKIRDLIGQRDDIDRELADKAAQEKHLRSVVAEYQAKLDGQPARESDLVELTRDYNTLQTRYQDLLAQREAAKEAANLERQNIGEQFRVLEPARVPERPWKPNRLLIRVAGPVGGLAVGLLLVAFLEYRQSGLQYEDDVTRLFNLPVLAVVPVLISKNEQRTAQRRRRVAVVATMVLLAAVVAWTLWSGYPA